MSGGVFLRCIKILSILVGCGYFWLVYATSDLDKLLGKFHYSYTDYAFFIFATGLIAWPFILRNKNQRENQDGEYEKKI